MSQLRYMTNYVISSWSSRKFRLKIWQTLTNYDISSLLFLNTWTWLQTGPSKRNQYQRILELSIEILGVFHHKTFSYQNYNLKLILITGLIDLVFIKDCQLVIFDQSGSFLTSCPNPLFAKIGQNLPKWRGTRSINLNMILKMIFKSHLETHIMTSVVAFWIFDLKIFLKVSSHSRKFLISNIFNFESITDPHRTSTSLLS